jgi:hypothetical protein
MRDHTVRLFQRKRMFVDAKVQGALLLRIVIYWLVGLLVVSQLLIYWKILSSPPRPFLDYLRLDSLWEEHGAVVLASLVMLPIFLVDALVMSNRFAGPSYRIRRSIHALACGLPIESLNLRRKDYWQDAAKDVNALSEYIEQLKKQAANASAHQKKTTADEPEPEPAAVH